MTETTDEVMKKPIASIYTFSFVVRAKNWNEVVTKLKDEIGINKKHDSSDREINGLYLVSCVINETDVTKDFYKKVADSEDVAIHSDGKSSSLYPKIFEETRIVEERLRWLLLHVSDAIEGYATLLGYAKNDIVEKSKLDPLTSRLSFEAMLTLLEIDQSWAREGVGDEKMRNLIDESEDFTSFKVAYLQKTTPKTIWESIGELVLGRHVEWGTIGPKLKSIKALRNKCAHFHTVTDDDFSQAEYLRTQIMNNLAKKKTYTTANMAAFAELNMQMTETIKVINESYMNKFQIATQSMSASRKIAESIGAIRSPVLDSLFANQNNMQNIYADLFNMDSSKEDGVIDTDGSTQDL